MNELRARVILQEKGIYKIQSGTAVKLAEISGRYRYETQTVSDYDTNTWRSRGIHEP